jgi:hypothetical protein
MMYLLIGLVWFLVAVALAASGTLQHLRQPGPQLLIVILTAGLLIAWRANRGFRAWLDALDLRAIVAFHLTRFVGAYFLFLYRKGELPFGFAVPGGWGDILVATSALVLLLLWPWITGHRGWLVIWNLVGFVDIMLVVASAAKHALADPASMAALLRLPLSLLATFLVPLIIASHVFIFLRLRGNTHSRQLNGSGRTVRNKA